MPHPCTRSFFKPFLFLAALTTITNSTEGFLAGAKATGMASTGVAYPQDAYAGAYNPAGAVEVGDRLDIGLNWIREHGHGKVKAKHKAVHGINGKFNAFSSPNLFIGDFGFNKNFRSNFCNQNWDWSIGLVIYNRDLQKTTYNKRVPLLGKTKLGLDYIHEVISPLASFRVTESHTVGISLDVHLQRLKASGLQQFKHSHFTLRPNNTTNNGYAYSSGLGASLGWKWQPYDCLTFGVTYHTKVRMSKLHKYKGLLAEKGRLDSPERWILGLAYQFLPCATFTFDFDWINWEQIKSLHNPLVHHGRIEKTGKDHGPGLGFRNQMIYRFGVDYAFDENWIFRAGYQHSNNLIKKKETALNLLTCQTVKNYLTLGATFSWNPSNELSFYYFHGFENKIKGKKSIPSSFGKGYVNLSQSKDSLGISWGHIF